MTLTNLSSPAASRAFTTEYTAVVVDKGQVVLDERFDDPSTRLTAIVNLMLSNHDEVAPQDVSDILAPYGGASPDIALGEVMALYANWGVDVDLHLSEHQRDVGPAVLYTTFTDYGDGTTFIEHYASAEERLKELRQRADTLSMLVDIPPAFFETADAEACRKVIEYALLPTGGRLYLLEASRQAVGETYTGENS